MFNPQDAPESPVENSKILEQFEEGQEVVGLSGLLGVNPPVGSNFNSNSIHIEKGVGANPESIQAPEALNLPDLSTFHLREGGREEIDTTRGVDAYSLSPKIWGLISQSNYPVTRVLAGDGTPLRVEIDNEGKVKPREWSEDVFTAEVLRVVKFFAWRGGKNAFQYIMPVPKELIRVMRAMPGTRIPLPSLELVADGPVVAPDGTIITANGYHEALKTYMHFDLALPNVPDAPTNAQISAARDFLLLPLQDFPFVDQASRATAVAAMLLPFLRNMVNGPTPIHLFNKPTAGTGASLLTDVILNPSCGLDVPKLGALSDEAEWNRSLGTILKDMPTALILDNIRELQSPQLCKAVTDGNWVMRIVGSSESATTPVKCLWIATGNNPTLHVEIARRCINCRMDAGLSEPWKGRTFKIPFLREWLQTNRPQLIAACLTLIRGWLNAGKPSGDKSLGMFESWAAVVGGVMQVAGIPGFLDGENEIVESLDIQTEAENWLVENWYLKHQSTKVW